LKNVLVITEPTTHAVNWIRTVLAPHGTYQISSISREQLRKSQLLAETQFDFILFDCDWLDKSEVQFLQQLNTITIDTPIVVMARQITIYSYGQVHEMKNIVTMQMPCEPQVFLAVVERVLQKENVKPDVCPRFITNMAVRIVVLENGLYLPTRLRNYSATGAFLEYHGISLKVGDRIQINLGRTQEQTKKNDSLLKNAKVVWIREGESSRSPARGVGVQFT